MGFWVLLRFGLSLFAEDKVFDFLPSVDPGLPLSEKKCAMRVILGSLLLLSTFSVDHPATRQPVATHVESIGYPDLARQTAIRAR